MKAKKKVDSKKEVMTREREIHLILVAYKIGHITLREATIILL